jgi:integrase
VKIRFKHVQRVKAKRGAGEYTYYRRNGQRIEGRPGSEEWLANYNRIHASFQAGEDAGPGPGSVGWLVERYLTSPGFSRLSPVSQKNYRGYLDRIRNAYANVQWTKITRRFVIELRDKNADSPATANYFLAMLSILGEVAIDNEIRTDNPANGVDRLKAGPGWLPWADNELQHFERNAIGAPLTAFMLALYTGQRRGDILKMTWAAIRDGGILIKQGKTGAELWIPLHPRLNSYLDTLPRKSLYIVSRQDGAPYTGSGFQTVFARELDRLDLKGKTFHGLRANAAGKLAEAGCTDGQIMAITGHKTRAMVTKYTRGADQKRLATEAIGKWKV